jgi:endoglucanase
VWSPAGNADAPLYYPGDEVVDYVGMTILGDAQWDQVFGLPPQSFAELVRPKYRVLAPFGKPMLVAELGVSGTSERKAEWLRDAAASLDEFPRILVFSYYDDVNAPNNRLRDQPDWRVPVATLADFVASVDRRG